jgi:hypothetical protein
MVTIQQVGFSCMPMLLLLKKEYEKTRKVFSHGNDRLDLLNPQFGDTQQLAGFGQAG